MTVRELRKLLKQLPQDCDVELEVGGDEAIHTGFVVDVYMPASNTVTLTSE